MAQAPRIFAALADPTRTRILMLLRAMELSKKRAEEIERVLSEKYQVDAKRLDALGRGWEEPAGTDSALNRRVEVQWFTVE